MENNLKVLEEYIERRKENQKEKSKLNELIHKKKEIFYKNEFDKIKEFINSNEYIKVIFRNMCELSKINNINGVKIEYSRRGYTFYLTFSNEDIIHFDLNLRWNDKLNDISIAHMDIKSSSYYINLFEVFELWLDKVLNNYIECKIKTFDYNKEDVEINSLKCVLKQMESLE